MSNYLICQRLYFSRKTFDIGHCIHLLAMFDLAGKQTQKSNNMLPDAHINETKKQTLSEFE